MYSKVLGTSVTIQFLGSLPFSLSCLKSHLAPFIYLFFSLLPLSEANNLGRDSLAISQITERAVHPCGPRPLELEAGRLRVEGQPQLSLRFEATEAA